MEMLATPPLLMAFFTSSIVTARTSPGGRSTTDGPSSRTSSPAGRLCPGPPGAWRPMASRPAEVIERGYEGLVGKDDASTYPRRHRRLMAEGEGTGWTDPEDRWKRRLTAPLTSSRCGS